MSDLPPLPADWMWEESYIYDAAGDAIPAADYVHAYGRQCAEAERKKAEELLREARAATVAAMELATEAARHLPATAPVDMAQAKRQCEMVTQAVARIDAYLERGNG
jgi:hypothetical protein